MGRAAADDEREIAAARPRAGQRAVGQRRRLVGQRRALAPRGLRASSAAEAGEPTSSSLLITTS